MDGELAHDEGLAMQADLQRVMLQCVDRLVSEMVSRFKRLKMMDDQFEFLLDVEELCYGNQHLVQECNHAAAFFWW